MTEDDEEFFRSKIEDIANCKDLRFPSSAGFKSWRLFFTEESISHPAKMNLYLLYYLIKKYTRKDEVVSDPMAGTGSTGIVASYLGRHSVLVDLEEKFYRMMVGWHPCSGWHCFKCKEREEKKREIQQEMEQMKGILKFYEEPLFFNRWIGLSLLFYTEYFNKLCSLNEDLENYPWDYPEPDVEHAVPGNLDLLEKHGGKNGEIQVLKGDARELADLLGVNADSIVTSPPYSESLSTTDDEERRLERTKDEYDECGYLRNKRKETASHRMGDGYSENPDNIGNLPHGSPDAIITSPPYEGVEPFKDRKFQRTQYPRSDRPCKGKEGPYLGPKVGVASLENKDNIGNLKSEETEYEALEEQVDAVITSPPYERTLHIDAEENNRLRREMYAKLKGKDTKNKEGWHQPPITIQGVKSAKYSENPDNIGNLKSEDGEYEELEKKVDAIVSSPPYSESPRAGNKDPDRFFEVAEKRHQRKFTGKSRRMMKKMHHSDNPDSLGNLRHGDIDAVVTSPPYSEKDENIANLSHGKVDTVITSPPYSEGLGHGRGRAEQLQKEKQLHLHGAESYSKSEENIGEIRTHGKIDTVLTSPPSADSKRQASQIDLEREVSSMETDTRQDTKHRRTPGRIRAIKSMLNGYGGSEENISNKKGETYLSAMLRVYREMFKVLKPGGKTIIIVKPFVRDKKVVDLPLHTWLLLRKCGFKLSEVLKFRLPQISFWRVLYRKKYPEVENINHEYVLVCQK